MANLSQRAVIVGRLVLLSLAAFAVVFAVLETREREHVRASAGASGRYACPMHLEITSDSPGDCPICHMALEPVAALARETNAPGAGTSEEAKALGTALSLPPEAADLVQIGRASCRERV